MSNMNSVVSQAMSADLAKSLQNFKFFRIKVKPQLYNSSEAIAIFVSDSTNKVHAKFQKIQMREKRQERVQAESYKSTISHELRTPLESSTQILGSAIEQVKSLG